jgi:N-dimethylarginine dimethylaminohydrolase
VTFTAVEALAVPTNVLGSVRLAFETVICAEAFTLAATSNTASARTLENCLKINDVNVRVLAEEVLLHIESLLGKLTEQLLCYLSGERRGGIWGRTGGELEPGREARGHTSEQ